MNTVANIIFVALMTLLIAAGVNEMIIQRELKKLEEEEKEKKK